MRMILFLPEGIMLLAAAVFLVLACRPRRHGRDYLAALFMGILGVAAAVAAVTQSGTLFDGALRVDPLSQTFKVMLAVGFLLVAFLCQRLDGVAAERHGEFYFLLATCTLALMLLSSAVHLVAVFLALEVSSYCLYLLVSLRRQPARGLPSGLRYFLVGASASAIMLFGLSLVYGSTGGLHLDTLAARLPAVADRAVPAAGLLLAFAGFFFKLAVFPFHLWAPDAYDAAPNQVAAFIAAVSKVAAVVVLIRVTASVQSLGALLSPAMVVLAIVTMTVGNLCAIAQKDFKRLMAFSSIAHAGYLLVGLLCMTPDGYAAIAFYAAAVLVMKLTCFMVLIQAAPDGRNLQIAELAGLHRRAPLLAMALMLALFGLAGIPPTIGFAGKLMIFSAAIKQGYLGLVVVAMVNVVISLYYYLLVLKAAYLDEPETDPPAMEITFRIRVLAVALIVAIVGIGFYPAGLIEVVTAAAQGLP